MQSDYLKRINNTMGVANIKNMTNEEFIERVDITELRKKMYNDFKAIGGYKKELKLYKELMCDIVHKIEKLQSVTVWHERDEQPIEGKDVYKICLFKNTYNGEFTMRIIRWDDIYNNEGEWGQGDRCVGWCDTPKIPEDR